MTFFQGTIVRRRKAKSEFANDRLLAQRIRAGDKAAWEEFVNRFTDWVFYCALKFTENDMRYATDDEKLAFPYEVDGKRFYYTEETQEAYLWIFKRLEKKLESYKGDIPLSVFVWCILNTKQSPHFLRSEYFKWRYGNANYIPRILQDRPEMMQEVFKLKRRQKTTHQIAKHLEIEEEQVIEYLEKILQLLDKVGLKYLLEPHKYVQLNPDIYDPPGDYQLDALAIFNDLKDKFKKCLKMLSEEKSCLLRLFYADGLSAKEILDQNVRAKCDSSQQNAAEAKYASEKDVYNALNEARKKLLIYFKKECTDARDYTASQQIVKIFLSQLGVVLQ